MAWLPAGPHASPVGATPGPGPGAALQPSGSRASGTGRQAGPNTRAGWWADPEIKAALGLTEEQTKRIREIFERRELEVKPLLAMLNRESDRLDHMTKERVADDLAYAVQVSKVENLVARWRESRTVMIYRMYRELQPDQHKKLQEILDRRRSAGRGSGPR